VAVVVTKEPVHNNTKWQTGAGWEVLNADITPLVIEDPTPYRTPRGFHIAAHQYNGTYVDPKTGKVVTVPYGDPRMASGAHIFATVEEALKVNGTWHTSPYPLYDNALRFANGTAQTMNYRERPEVIAMSKGGESWPRYLLTGTEWGHKCQYPTCNPGQSCQSVSVLTELEWGE